MQKLPIVVSVIWKIKIVSSIILTLQKWFKVHILYVFL